MKLALLKKNLRSRVSKYLLSVYHLMMQDKALGMSLYIQDNNLRHFLKKLSSIFHWRNAFFYFNFCLSHLALQKGLKLPVFERTIRDV